MKIKNDILYISLGIIISSAAYAFFIVPAKLIPGGVSGIAIILHHLFRTPFGIVMLVLNIPLLIIGMKLFGKTFGARTMIATILISLITDGFTYFLKPLIFDSGNLLLSSVYGGALLGIGLGLVFKGKGSTGGSDILGRIISNYFPVSIGYSIMIVDTIIIIGSSLIFRNYELILFSFITLFLSSKAIDMLLEGRDYARGVYIFTIKPDIISREIIKAMNRGVTGFKGVGMFTETEKTMLYIVVSRREITRLTTIVENIDESAFMVVQNVHEVLGKGFPRR
ncbi:YitT family protein [candidate division WOR-3 bacterium]|nr:YitT family protein [candidate division WOR-3 bacterium]